MIAGVMSKRKQLFHTWAAAFISAVFVAAGLVNGQFFFPARGSQANRGMQVVAFLFILLAIGILAMQDWFRRRIIREFSYDGVTLHFTTLANSETQARLPSQLVDIRDWAGRGGVMGHQLFFRDAPKAFLEDTTPNSAELIRQLKLDTSQGS